MLHSSSSPLSFLSLPSFVVLSVWHPKTTYYHPPWQLINGVTWVLCDRLNRVKIYSISLFAFLSVIQAPLSSLTSLTNFFQRIPVTEIHFCLGHRNFSKRLKVPKAGLYSLEDHAESAAASALLLQSRFPHPNPTFPVKPGSVKEGEPNCYMCRFGLTRFLLTEHTGWPRTP